MAERIVSPGVFTRERDLSFLPQGIANIGAAIVGPTLKGPSFVPTVVRDFQEFQAIFGGYTPNYYTPYTVNEYLKSAGSVTIVRVGHLGGYDAESVNLVVESVASGNEVVATFLPAGPNAGGSISASLAVGAVANSFDLELCGANATASLTGLTLVETGAGTGTDLLLNQVPITPGGPSATIGATSAPMYAYKYFRSQMSASFESGRYLAAAPLTLEVNQAAAKINFKTGTTSVDSDTYVSTISGNADASAARTPYIQSQKISGTAQDLFRIYTRSDGTATNSYYIVIRDVKAPSLSNSSPEYAEFGLSLYKAPTGLSDTSPNLLENYSNLNLDPASPNFIGKVIGDQFQSVDDNGNTTVYGSYTNLSQWIRLGDYSEEAFESNKALQPMGYAAVKDVVKATAAVVSSSFQRAQSLDGKNDDDAGAVWKDVPYGFLIDPRVNESLWNGNKEYLAPVPYGETVGANAVFSLENMNGFGSGSEIARLQDLYGSSFVTASATLTTAAAAVQLKYAVPFQEGFDGSDPAVTANTGAGMTAANTMGFNCSSALSSGSKSYKRALNAVSNPDDLDINMVVTPGVVHKLHSTVTNHAIDMVENRADAFYVMDSSAIEDNVSTAVNNVKQLNTNYVATYFPWVKIVDPGSGKPTWVPPSVVIPGVIAFTDRVAHEWFAPAGLNRGGLQSVTMAKKKLTHTDRDTLYEGKINPIATFPGQGVVVFGQKTLQSKPSALDRINVRRLLIKLKKFIASSSRFLVFEQNNSSTRARFLNIVNPFLESVQANSGLSAFKVVMDDSNNTPDVIDRNQLVGQIFIQPTRTAEFIVLDFTVLPTGATFPE